MKNITHIAQYLTKIKTGNEIGSVNPNLGGLFKGLF